MSRGSILTLYRAYPKFKVPDDVFLLAQKEYEDRRDDGYPRKTKGLELPEIVRTNLRDEYEIGEDGIRHEVKPKTIDDYRRRRYTGYFLRDRRIWCDKLIKWDFGSSFDALIEHYSLNPYYWNESDVLISKEDAAAMLAAIEYILGGVWNDRLASALRNNPFVNVFTDGYNCLSYWKYKNRREIEANRKVCEFENEGCKVTVSFPDRKEEDEDIYSREDAEWDEAIEGWLRDFATGIRAFLESDEHSYDGEHELVLVYSCWG